LAIRKHCCATEPSSIIVQGKTSGDTVGGLIWRGSKRVIDPNNPPPMVRRRNPPKA
jgi:hypothetical protein